MLIYFLIIREYLTYILYIYKKQVVNLIKKNTRKNFSVLFLLELVFYFVYYIYIVFYFNLAIF